MVSVWQACREDSRVAHQVADGARDVAVAAKIPSGMLPQSASPLFSTLPNFEGADPVSVMETRLRIEPAVCAVWLSSALRTRDIFSAPLPEELSCEQACVVVVTMALACKVRAMRLGVAHVDVACATRFATGDDVVRARAAKDWLLFDALADHVAATAAATCP